MTTQDDGGPAFQSTVLLKHGVVADNKTSISEFVDRLGAERDELRECLRLALPELFDMKLSRDSDVRRAELRARIRKALEEA